MSQQGDQQWLTIQPEIRAYYSSRQDNLVVPVSTWNGFIERVKGSRPEYRPWSIAYSVLFGIGITAGLSIAPLLIADANFWIVAIYAGAAATSILVGVALIFMERQLTRHQGSQIHQLASEMLQIRDERIGGEIAS